MLVRSLGLVSFFIFFNILTLYFYLNIARSVLYSSSARLGNAFHSRLSLSPRLAVLLLCLGSSLYTGMFFAEAGIIVTHTWVG